MSRNYYVMSLIAVISLCIISPTLGQTDRFIARVGKYSVQLRIPVGGLSAGQETDVELHIADASQDDPVQGPPPVVNAKLVATVTMPIMASMPSQTPKIHQEGVAGDYGVVMFFPHGGDYLLKLSIVPPGDSSFSVTFKLPVGDAKANSAIKRPLTLPYSLSISTLPATPKNGEEVQITANVHRQSDGEIIKDFDTVHERKLHLIIVRKDLQFFSHEHPELDSNGNFMLKYTFPSGGDYQIFADSAPKGAGSVVVSTSLKVSGESIPGSARSLENKTSDAVDGVVVRLQNSIASLMSGRTQSVTFSLTDAAGAKITDVEPWLGAAAHLILIHQDSTTFVHSHPDETSSNNGRNGFLTFNARFPKSGIYRGWLQFQRSGKVSTAVITVKVAQ